MKRIIHNLALVLVLLTSACALPNPNPAPSGGGQSMPTPRVSQAQATPPNPAAAATTANSATVEPSTATQPQPPAPAVTSAGSVYLPEILSGGQPSPNAADAYPQPVAAAETRAPSAAAPHAPTATPQVDSIARVAPYEPHTGEQTPYQDWKQWPVLPVVSERAREIYQAGLTKGNNPNRFSKIGDCQVIRQYFLGYFDNGNNEWRLGDRFGKYKEALAHFEGSYNRLSMAVRTGFNVASVLSAINADPKTCQSGETPLQCELRDWNPSIAIISMETWTENRPTAAYEGYLRKIVDETIADGVLPILATKADNLEGDHSINQMIARVAYEYDIPLWNFWAAADPLPSHGLLEDGFHLTNGPSELTGAGLQIAWNVRNLTALQAIDRVWRAVR